MLSRSLALLALAFSVGCAGAAPPAAVAPSPEATVVADAPPPPPAPIVAMDAAPQAQAAGNLFGDVGGKAPGAPQTFSTHGAPKAVPAKPPPPPPPEEKPKPQEVRRESLLIYTATLVLAVFKVDQSLTQIEELSRGMGGYLASRSDAAIVVRVPKARFQDLVAEIAKVGDVLHRNIEAIDVSDQVVDLEARLKNARAMRDRLEQLLQGAKATKDALEIEKELGRVMADIEVMEGKLQLFNDKIAYSTVTVNFQPLHTNHVHSMARLPFPWLNELGLSSLLQVSR